MRRKVHAQWIREVCDELRAEATANPGHSARSAYGWISDDADMITYSHDIGVSMVMQGSMRRYEHRLSTATGDLLFASRDRESFSKHAAAIINEARRT